MSETIQVSLDSAKHDFANEKYFYAARTAIKALDAAQAENERLREVLRIVTCDHHICEQCMELVAAALRSVETGMEGGNG